jgi:hypothetical protein
MIKQAGNIRQSLHRIMLKLDDKLCENRALNHQNIIANVPHASELAAFLHLVAKGEIEAHYVNGLKVPRSLFYSNFAMLLLSKNPDDRKIVSTPYGFSSSMEIVMKKNLGPNPWGTLTNRS